MECVEYDYNGHPGRSHSHFITIPTSAARPPVPSETMASTGVRRKRVRIR